MQCEDNKERMDCYDALFIEYADAASVIGSDTQVGQTTRTCMSTLHHHGIATSNRQRLEIPCLRAAWGVFVNA